MIAHKGNCFCGAVEIQVQGEHRKEWATATVRPAAPGPHAPVNAFTLWKPQDVRVTKGAEFIGKFMKTGCQPSSTLQAVRRASDDGSSSARIWSTSMRPRSRP